MDLRHLRTFVTVAQEQSFTRAAARLRIAQPPLSRQLQQLEEELGVTLIERGSRPARMTEPGRILYEQAVQILERVADLRTLARRLRDSRQNRLAIGFVASTLYGYLPDILRAYRAARPGTELSVLELVSLEQIAALKDGRIDVGFGRIPFDDPAITRELLRNEVLVAALPDGHPALAAPGLLRLDALQSDPLIVYPKSPRPSYADQVIGLYRTRNIRPPVVHEVRELQTALGLVAAGLGVCLVPSAVQRLQRDAVTYRAIDDALAISPIIMSTRRDDSSPELRLIREVIVSIYQREGLVFGA